MSPGDRGRCEAVGHFPELARFRFELCALDAIRLPPYAGSAWRGLLGHGLRRTACVTHAATCDGCLLRHTCTYSVIFETPAAADQATKGYTALPHPFVLEPDLDAPREIAEGAPLRLAIILIGSAIEQAPYLIHALNVAGTRGFGRAGGRFEVAAVHRETGLGSEQWQEVFAAHSGQYLRLDPAPSRLPPPSPSVTLTLRTPLRVKRHGHFVGAHEFEPADLLRNLAARLALLAELYGGQPESFAWGRLRAAAPEIGLAEANLRWHEWARYSSRQDTLMQMGGLLGELTLAGPGLPSFWPALWFGQWCHVGKGTSLGLGGYRLTYPGATCR